MRMRQKHIKENITYKRAKRSALSPKDDHTAVIKRRDSMAKTNTNKIKDLGQFPIQSAQILTACG